VEFRGGGADATPYLILAGLLAAGADGLERQLDPGPEATGDLYEDPGDHRPLPATFADGIAAFRDSELAGSLGEDFSTNLLALVSNELTLYEANASDGDNSVSTWEFDRYVEFT
jgi:glutamine synthetase